jgi:molybdate transport system ATP-binding protein
MIDLSDVTVLKNGRKLFDNFSFKMQPGENWLIQGANGSGKTLLLELIAGSLHPYSGSIHHSFLEATDWDSRYRERQQKIHLVPTHWLQAFLGGFEHLFYQQRYYTMDETELPKVRDVFGSDVEKLKTSGISDNFNIEALIDLHLTRISNGQIKKVIILRHLMRDIPKLLLLDYPFDGLDAESRQDFNTFLDDIAVKFGIQVIIVDHGHVLPSVMNRRLVLNQFRIEKVESIVHPPAMSGQNKNLTMAASDTTAIPVVEMQNVTIKYSGKKVFSDLSWRINKGERWALTGKNGSGKTTLFSLIYADHPMAYSQKVFLFGRRRGTGESIWDIKKRINYFGPEQVHFLNPRGIAFTAREYILMQQHKNPERLRELIDFFNASPYIDHPIRFLSSGQLQMALLIDMFMDTKELLLLDEPFQFLDPGNHEKITNYLNEYLDKDVTLIMITHDEKDVQRWTQLHKHL